MQKTFKLISLSLIALFMSMSFIACDPPEGEGNGTNSGGTTGTPGAMSTSGKRIKTMLNDSDMYTFSYDAQGRVASCVQSCNDGTVYTATYTYGNNSIEVVHTDNGEPDGRDVYTLANGLVSNLTSYDDDGSVSYTESYQFQDKNFVGCTYTDEEGPYNTHFTWSNGNLTEWDDEGDFTTFDYNTTASRDKIELWLVTNDYDLALVLQGYFGNGTKNRLNQVTSSSSDGDEYHMTLYYNYNDDGDVASFVLMFMGMPDTYTFTWE